MTLPSLLKWFALPALGFGIAFGAAAQGEPSLALEQPTAAKDKVLVEAAFTKADASGDGALTREEAARLPAIATRFDALDRDRDGRLSLEEFALGVIAPG